MCQVQWFCRPEELDGEGIDAYLFHTGAEDFAERELFVTDTHDDFDLCEFMDAFKRCVALPFAHHAIQIHCPIALF